MQPAFQILTSPNLDIEALGLVFNKLFHDKLTAAQDKSLRKLSAFDKVIAAFTSFKYGESTTEQDASVWGHVTCTILLAAAYTDLPHILAYLSPVTLTVAPTDYGLPALVMMTTTFDRLRDGIQEGLSDSNRVVSQFFSDLKKQFILDGCSQLWADMSTSTTSSIRLIEKTS